MLQEHLLAEIADTCSLGHYMALSWLKALGLEEALESEVWNVGPGC